MVEQPTIHTHTHIYTCICTCTHTRSGATPFRGRERQYRRDARCVTGAGSAPLSEVMISCAPQGRRWSPRRSCAAPEVCCYLGIDYRVPSAHDSWRRRLLHGGGRSRASRSVLLALPSPSARGRGADRPLPLRREDRQRHRLHGRRLKARWNPRRLRALAFRREQTFDLERIRRGAEALRLQVLGRWKSKRAL